MLTGQEILHILNDAAKRKMEASKMEALFIQLRQISNGDFTEEMAAKATGIIHKVDEAERNISEEVYEYARMQPGIFTTNQCYGDLAFNSKEEKAAVRKTLQRLVERGIIESHGEKSGVYRKILSADGEQQWWVSEGHPLNIVWPLGIGIKQPRLFPGNIILVEGEKSQGKTRFCIEFARENKGLFSGQRIRYQNVEMGNDEILSRVREYERNHEWSTSEFREDVEIVRVTDLWWDFVLPDGLNIVDYLVQYDEPWMMPKNVFRIHEKLRQGIALLVVQKDPLKAYGSGGYAIRNIPRVIISLSRDKKDPKAHRITLEDVKSFGGMHNPSGLSKKYKMPGLCKFKIDERAPWERVDAKGKVIETVENDPVPPPDDDIPAPEDEDDFIHED